MTTNRSFTVDFADVRGPLRSALSAIEDAAVAHLIGQATLLVLAGPPGNGKTMLARRIPTILPALDDHAQAWLTAEYEGLGLCPRGGVTDRPFRAPHHTISQAALAGDSWRGKSERSEACETCAKVARRGGTPDPFHLWHVLPRCPTGRPGEVQLARYGVLFLDELNEFGLAAIERLAVAIRDMAPATRPMLVGSVTPCPCGWVGSGVRTCTCTSATVSRYVERVERVTAALATPIGARISTVTVGPVTPDDLRNAAPVASSADIAARIAARI